MGRFLALRGHCRGLCFAATCGICLAANRDCGGIGRRAGFRFQWVTPWGFESPQSHAHLAGSEFPSRLCFPDFSRETVTGHLSERASSGYATWTAWVDQQRLVRLRWRSHRRHHRSGSRGLPRLPDTALRASFTRSARPSCFEPRCRTIAVARRRTRRATRATSRSLPASCE
jgi:hypothetical protein